MGTFTLELANGKQYTLPLYHGANYYAMLRELITREGNT